MSPAGITVRVFTWADWPALWELRACQLAEHGVRLDTALLPAGPLPVPRGDPEWDYHHIAEVYLAGAGGFWLAWRGADAVGHVGGQDLGGVVELRRMYVRADARRQGAGRALVGVLLEHARCCGACAVELWTGADGPGRALYAAMGFAVTSGPGEGYEDLAARTGYAQGADEVRMRWVPDQSVRADPR